MYVALIRGSTFAGVLGAPVQKIFYTFIGTVVYLYLFLCAGHLRPAARRRQRPRFLVPLLIISGWC
jgi:hypothetical protein